MATLENFSRNALPAARITCIEWDNGLDLERPRPSPLKDT